jgi:hypothetical protein
LTREEKAKPQDLIVKLNPAFEASEACAADGSSDKCSLAVFAFIQSFFSN